MADARPTLDADTATRLAEFARACKAAARAVSLYPTRHPAIGSTLGRLTEITTGLTAEGPFALEVRPNTICVGDRAPAKPDSAVVELSELLRRQLVGSLTLNAGADAESWRTLLMLLARPPEEVRGDGGIARLWAAAGRLSAEGMLELLLRRTQPAAMAGTVNVVTAMVQRMSDTAVAQFVSTSVIAERGATDRLAQAFQALVPDNERQRQLLALAETDVAASELGSQDEAFAELWGRVESMLTSYSDEKFVSDTYARELSGARDRAIEGEATSADPPERMAGWLATVGDAALRNLDALLLADLLRIEEDPARWRDVAETVIGHAEDL